MEQILSGHQFAKWRTTRMSDWSCTPAQFILVGAKSGLKYLYSFYLQGNTELSEIQGVNTD